IAAAVGVVYDVTIVEAVECEYGACATGGKAAQNAGSLRDISLVVDVFESTGNLADTVGAQQSAGGERPLVHVFPCQGKHERAGGEGRLAGRDKRISLEVGEAIGLNELDVGWIDDPGVELQTREAGGIRAQLCRGWSAGQDGALDSKRL